MGGQYVTAKGGLKTIGGAHLRGSYCDIDNKVGSRYRVALCRSWATAVTVAATGLFRWTRAAFTAENMEAIAPNMLRRAKAHTQLIGQADNTSYTYNFLAIADNDGAGAGIKSAERTGFPVWAPPEEGDSANDFKLSEGIDKLREQLSKCLQKSGA